MKNDWMLYPISERLFNSIEDTNEIRKIDTLYVMAPTMCMYVLWVLNEAMKSNKNRLYFLARDGYSMYEIAKIFCEQLQLPIECRYLYCSRYAWRHAEYHLLGEGCLEYICLGGIDVTLAKIMHRAGLSDEEGRQVAVLLQKEEEYQEVLSYQQVKALKPVLAGCALFMERTLQGSRETYPLVCAYLKQEGLLEEGWAVVDSGWTGSMQKCLGNILKSMGYNKQIEGYYFGMYEYPQGVDRERYHTWYFCPDNGLRRKVYFSNSLFECIFSSPEGMTVGYKLCKAGYVPILEHRENANLDKIRRSTEYLQQYASLLAAEYGTDILNRKKHDVEEAYALLHLFMGKPTIEEAWEYGNYVFCDDVIGEAKQKIAAPLNIQEIKENRLLHKASNLIRKQGTAIHESAWLEGSIMLCREAGARERKHCIAYKYVLYLRKLMK